uniref:Reverse transcriptase domain-containing protein n=1 Tax=Tanacetum cinerariifolium TaxID=118510 RepID=A0A6L2K389_TANCI|nr:reverse transcriptase domain-containing protein [Tanacetum cinerariifolium]
MEDDFKPAVQHQRRVNPKIHEVIKKEAIKLLDAGLIYPISDSPWVSPVHCVPKKGGMTVVENEDNELLPTSLDPFVEIPSGEIKVQIEVLSMLWGNGYIKSGQKSKQKGQNQAQESLTHTHATVAILINLIGGRDVESYKQLRLMTWRAIKEWRVKIRDGRSFKRLEGSSAYYK